MTPTPTGEDSYKSMRQANRLINRQKFNLVHPHHTPTEAGYAGLQFVGYQLGQLLSFADQDISDKVVNDGGGWMIWSGKGGVENRGTKDKRYLAFDAKEWRSAFQLFEVMNSHGLLMGQAWKRLLYFKDGVWGFEMNPRPVISLEIIFNLGINAQFTIR